MEDIFAWAEALPDAATAAFRPWSFSLFMYQHKQPVLPLLSAVATLPVPTCIDGRASSPRETAYAQHDGRVSLSGAAMEHSSSLLSLVSFPLSDENYDPSLLFAGAPTPQLQEGRGVRSLLWLSFECSSQDGTTGVATKLDASVEGH